MLAGLLHYINLHWQYMAVVAGDSDVHRAHRFAYQEELRRRQEQQERKERLAMVKTLGDLLVLTASEFEHRVADLFVLLGYSNVQTTGGSGDLMADIRCTSTHGEKVVVQCKRYVRDHNISSPEIQKFAGMVYAYHKADQGIFITTSSFTVPAIELGKTLHIELIDGEMLCQLFLRVEQLAPPDERHSKDPLRPGKK